MRILKRIWCWLVPALTEEQKKAAYDQDNRAW
jgi:hypothetical protein